jgi:hypothetical protein
VGTQARKTKVRDWSARWAQRIKAYGRGGTSDKIVSPTVDTATHLLKTTELATDRAVTHSGQTVFES